MKVPKRTFRCMVRANKRSPEGHPVIAFGLRFGYWPCLKAPFITIAVGPVTLDFWHGLPSYQQWRHVEVRGPLTPEASEG